MMVVSKVVQSSKFRSGLESYGFGFGIKYLSLENISCNGNHHEAVLSSHFQFLLFENTCRHNACMNNS